MKHFESFLAPWIEKYIAYRQGLGYKDNNIRYLLFHLDRYVKDTQAAWESFTPNFFLGLRGKLKQDPRTINRIMTGVRGFFQFLVRVALMEENPLKDLPPCTQKAYMPFIFSGEEIEYLLKAVQKKIRKSEKYFLKDLAAYMCIVLMARCGLRIGEPRRILRTQYRPQEGTVYIEKTKFNKDRLIPMPKALMVDIENYLALRTSLLGQDNNPYLFSGGGEGEVPAKRINSFFHEAVKDINLDHPKRIMANIIFGSPRPHSLRHAFAINTLKKIKERGKSPQSALPILAAYMGHRKYRYTALYLKLLDAQQGRALVDFTVAHVEEE